MENPDQFWVENNTVPSQRSSFRRSARFERKMTIAPLNGSSSGSVADLVQPELL